MFSVKPFRTVYGIINGSEGFDLDTAEAMYRAVVIFMLCSSVSKRLKLTKGLRVLMRKQEAPWTHNFYSVFRKTFDSNQVLIEKEFMKRVLSIFVMLVIRCFM